MKKVKDVLINNLDFIIVLVMIIGIAIAITWCCSWDIALGALGLLIIAMFVVGVILFDNKEGRHKVPQISLYVGTGVALIALEIYAYSFALNENLPFYPKEYTESAIATVEDAYSDNSYVLLTYKDKTGKDIKLWQYTGNKEVAVGDTIKVYYATGAETEAVPSWYLQRLSLMEILTI